MVHLDGGVLILEFSIKPTHINKDRIRRFWRLLTDPNIDEYVFIRPRWTPNKRKETNITEVV